MSPLHSLRFPSSPAPISSRPATVEFFIHSHRSIIHPLLGNNPLSPYRLHGFPDDLGDDQGSYQLGYQDAIVRVHHDSSWQRSVVHRSFMDARRLHPATTDFKSAYHHSSLIYVQSYVFWSNKTVLNADMGDAVNMEIANTASRSIHTTHSGSSRPQVRQPMLLGITSH